MSKNHEAKHTIAPFHVVLYEPEIPPNTGNIIRLCANTGSFLHLIEPLGFTLENKKLTRAGLDYIEWENIKIHPNLASFESLIQPKRLFPISTKGNCHYHNIQYQEGDAFLFGPETRGLPQEVLDKFSTESIIRIPMLPTSRSLNLSNAVAIIVYEASRQVDFRNLRMGSKTLD